jgi:hypothetical protein
MLKVREAAESSDISLFSHYLKRLPRELRNSYFEVINRDWFSHSDVFQLLNKFGLTLSHPFVQTHGLLDEAAYAKWNKSRLLGCDWQSWRAEAIVAGYDQVGISVPTMADSHEALQQYALRIIEAPGLSLLATLTSDEILKLRDDASGIFRILDYVAEGDLIDGLYGLRDSYIDAVTQYWEKIVSLLRHSRPQLSQRNTKIGFFFRTQIPSFSNWVSKHISYSINIGLDLLSIPFPALKLIDTNTREKIINNLSFRFVFFCDNPAMVQLKKALPDRTWLSRFHNDVLRGGKID